MNFDNLRPCRTKRLRVQQLLCGSNIPSVPSTHPVVQEILENYKQRAILAKDVNVSVLEDYERKRRHLTISPANSSTVKSSRS